jgi:hypothetical protein
MTARLRRDAGAPTRLNLNVLVETFGLVDRVADGIAVTDLAHLRRCVAAGLVVVDPRGILTLTPAGRHARDAHLAASPHLLRPMNDVRPNPARRQRPSSPGPYADPELWQRAKEAALRRLGGRHSARAMQVAGALYRAAGGRYRGPPTAAQRSLAKWTREDWTTATGEHACRQRKLPDTHHGPSEKHTAVDGMRPMLIAGTTTGLRAH